MLSSHRILVKMHHHGHFNWKINGRVDKITDVLPARDWEVERQRRSHPRDRALRAARKSIVTRSSMEGVIRKSVIIGEQYAFNL